MMASLIIVSGLFYVGGKKLKKSLSACFAEDKLIGKPVQELN